MVNSSRLQSVSFMGRALFYQALFLLLLVPVFSWGAENAGKARVMRVLAIHSYHRTYVWEQTLEDNLDRKLHASDLRIAVFHETLDVLRISDQAFPVAFYDYLKSKYRTAPPDLIIVTDNAAFSFTVNYRDWLFGPVPVVFAGVNGFSPEQLLGEKGFTGISENPDMAATLKVAKGLFPSSRRIVVYGCWEQTYFGNLRLLRQAVNEMAPPMALERKENRRLSSILGDVAKLPPDSLIVIVSRVLNDEGQPMSVIRSTELISAAASVPVISFWDFLLGHGIVGGKLISAAQQGTEAARLAVRILRSPPGTPLPAVEESPNRFMFDYRQLKRFGVKLDVLPPGSIIINRPLNPWRAHWRFLTLVVGSILLLVAIIVYLAFTVARRKRAEETLQQSEERYRSLVENTLDGYFICDLDSGRFIFVNQRMCDLFDLSMKEILSLTIWDIVHPEEHAIIRDRVKRRLDGEEFGFDTNTYRGVRKFGSEFQAEISTSLVVYRGHPAIQGVLRDVTEKEELQLQLQHAQKLESVGRLAGGIAHDFNNKLMVILGFTEFILSEIEPEDPHYALLRQIMEVAMQSADLTRQLLAFARKQTIAPKVLDLNEAVLNTITMLRRLIGEDIRLVWNPAHGLWPVKMDPAQLDQVLANLCVNARDGITGTGTITIETSNVVLQRTHWAEHEEVAPGDYVMLTVMDDGCGMEKEILENAFEPFFTTKEVGKGTGLGLSTVYGIVRQNGGLVDLYSEPGDGTIVRIYLPRHGGKRLQRQRPETGPQAVACAQGETVLLVEDEAQILTTCRMMLQKLGYTVLAESNAEGAIRTAKEHSGVIHLLLTDVIMPVSNGQELAEQITHLRPDTKVLFMSGYTAEVIVPHGVLDAGVHFIRKPFSLSDLAAKIREVLDLPVTHQ